MVLLDSIVLLCIISLASRVNAQDEGEGWSYTQDGSGPSDWGGLEEYPACDGTSQSPIDIVTADAVYDSSLGTFTFVDASSNHSWYIENDARHIKVTVNDHGECMDYYEYDDGATLCEGLLSEGGFMKTYKLSHMDWHWGTNDTHGSEHRIDGIAYPMELHLVYYSEEFSYFYNAEFSEIEDDVVILAVLYEISVDDNEVINAVLAHEDDLGIQYNSVALTDNFAIASLLPSDLTRYARYSGSQTTPPCTENVKWTVFMDTLTLTAAQMGRMRSSFWVSDTLQMSMNYRPIQEVNGRTVSLSWEVDPTNDITDTTNDITDTTNDITDTANDSTDTANDNTDTANESTDTTNDSADTANESTDTTNDSADNHSESDMELGNTVEEEESASNIDHDEDSDTDSDTESVTDSHPATDAPTNTDTGGASMQCASLVLVVALAAVCKLF